MYVQNNLQKPIKSRKRAIIRDVIELPTYDENDEDAHAFNSDGKLIYDYWHDDNYVRKNGRWVLKDPMKDSRYLLSKKERDGRMKLEQDVYETSLNSFGQLNEKRYFLAVERFQKREDRQRELRRELVQKLQEREERIAEEEDILNPKYKLKDHKLILAHKEPESEEGLANIYDRKELIRKEFEFFEDCIDNYGVLDEVRLKWGLEKFDKQYDEYMWESLKIWVRHQQKERKQETPTKKEPQKPLKTKEKVIITQKQHIESSKENQKLEAVLVNS
ncbi:MAG: hypothetical protein IJ837_03735 [Clostridia bacterium]|nr:hypothetical protein [Clostridia bacterium]